MSCVNCTRSHLPVPVLSLRSECCSCSWKQLRTCGRSWWRWLRHCRAPSGRHGQVGWFENRNPIVRVDWMSNTVQRNCHPWQDGYALLEGPVVMLLPVAAEASRSWRNPLSRIRQSWARNRSFQCPSASRRILSRGQLPCNHQGLRIRFGSTPWWMTRYPRFYCPDWASQTRHRNARCH